MSKKIRIKRAPRILVLEQGYGSVSRCVSRHGGDVTTVNPRDVEKMEEALLVEWDGLVLSGGGDLDPRLYGEKPHRKVYGVSGSRDLTEMIALDYATDAGISVLGICRGAQMIAVHNGGRLKQHVPGHRGIDHLVFTETSSKFRRTVGQAGIFPSLHHQVITRHGKDMRVAARERTGMIEAIESTDGRVLGVQFHPEIDHGVNKQSRLIFEAFVKDAARRAGLVVPKPVKPTASRPAKRYPKPRALPGLEGPPKPRKRSVQKGVTVSWLCPQCALRFDSVDDREDHIAWVHGDPRLAVARLETRRVPEPPPGHPDWL